MFFKTIQSGGSCMQIHRQRTHFDSVPQRDEWDIYLFLQHGRSTVDQGLPVMVSIRHLKYLFEVFHGFHIQPRQNQQCNRGISDVMLLLASNQFQLRHYVES